MIACTRSYKRPIVDDATRFFAAYLVAEQLHAYMRDRAQLRARPTDGEWAHFFENLHGGIVSEASTS